MARRSVYLPQPSIHNDRMNITGEEHRHLVVARAEKGEEIEVFDGRGNVWVVAVESLEKRGAIARVIDSRQAPRPEVEIILALAMIRNAAFELALGKVVEIGVTRI